MAVASLVACAVFAQTAPAPPARTHGPEETGQTTQPAEPIATVTARGVDEAPEFEAASVKISQPGSLGPGRIQGTQGGPGSRDPGLFQCTSCTLRPVLLRAYDLQPYQLFGPPSIDEDRYDIFAKLQPDATRKEFALMLQDLLVTRFGLAVHKETRVLPIYELVVAKGGPKLKEPEKPPASQAQPAAAERPSNGRPGAAKMAYATDKDGNAELPPGTPAMILFGMGPGARLAGASARMMTIDVLLRGLGSRIDRPVVDKTGLNGVYDFKLVWAPDRAGTSSPQPPESPSGQVGLLDAASDPAPTLFAAFERQLGLKFEDKRGPVQVLVVDKVNRTPKEN